MTEIHVGPKMQVALLAAVLTAIIAVIVLQLPEIKRYLKVKQM